MRSYILMLQLYHIRNDVDPVNFRKQKKTRAAVGTLQVLKSAQNVTFKATLHQEERADEYMLVSRGVPVFVS